MSITVLSFGQLTAFMGSDLLLEEPMKDTDGLKQFLENRHPALRELSYIIAVDKNIINQNTLLNDNAIVALLPPYSGG